MATKTLKRALLSLMMLALLPGVLMEKLARKLAGRDVWFEPQAEWLSLVPGRWGCWARAAFYHMSLVSCPLEVGIHFGSLITHSETELGSGVYIGMRSIIGWARIAEGALIADGVHVLSGAHHHGDGAGDAAASQLRRLELAARCWIGAKAVVMADVGESAVVGAGSVVTRPVEARTTVAGNPARLLRRHAATAGG